MLTTIIPKFCHSNRLKCLLTGIFMFRALSPSEVRAQGNLCIKIDPSAECPLTPSELITDEAASVAEAVESPDPRNQIQGDKSRGSLGIAATFGRDFTVVNLPLSVPFGSHISLNAGVPWISISSPDYEDQGFGNASLGTTLTFITSSQNFGLSGAFGLRLPTGKKTLVGDRAAIDRMLAIATLFGSKDQKLLISFGILIKPPDNLDQNLGDIRVFFAGYDRSLTNLLGVYSGLESTYIETSTIQDRILSSANLMVDGSFGVTIDFFDLRLGVTLPLYTATLARSSESGETLNRELSLDAGLRYDL